MAEHRTNPGDRWRLASLARDQCVNPAAPDAPAWLLLPRRRIRRAQRLRVGAARTRTDGRHTVAAIMGSDVHDVVADAAGQLDLPLPFCTPHDAGLDDARADRRE